MSARLRPDGNQPGMDPEATQIAGDGWRPGCSRGRSCAAVHNTVMPPLVALLDQLRPPAMYSGRPWVAAGGLMSHGQDPEAADFMDKILRGAKASPPSGRAAHGVPVRHQCAGERSVGP